MTFDVATLSALGFVLFITLLFTVANFRSYRHTRRRVADLEAQAEAVGSPAGRRLVEAIHVLYPKARLGVDFTLREAEDGSGPVIREWLLDEPMPEPETLERLMGGGGEKAGDYAERRAAEYPSVGDQLDALYKARQGDSGDLERIDAAIAEVKARYPKPEG
jgi:hypothetical protein